MDALPPRLQKNEPNPKEVGDSLRPLLENYRRQQDRLRALPPNPTTTQLCNALTGGNN